MPRGIRILKTKIKSRSEAHAKVIENIMLQGKKLTNPKHKKKELKLFQKVMVERQSMKRAHAIRKWENFIKKNLPKKAKSS